MESKGIGLDKFFTSLADNGPWALVAGFLIWWLIKNADKTQTLLISVLTDFRGAIDRLTTSVDKLGERMDDLERRHKE